MGKRKKGSTFEDLNELAKQQQKGGGGGLSDMMAELGEYDLESIMAGLSDSDIESLSQMMSSPEFQKEYQKYFAELGLSEDDVMEKVGDAMKILSDPEKLADAMSTVLGTLGSEEFIGTMVKEKDTMLDQMEKTGLLSEEQIQQYRNNPNKFGEDIQEAFGKMKEVLSDPKMMKQLQETINPKQMEELMGAYKDFDLSSLVNDDTKSEEARLGLLDPSNPLAALFSESEEMREILHDPVKFKAAMKEGLDLLTNTGGARTTKGRAVLTGDEL